MTTDKKYRYVIIDDHSLIWRGVKDVLQHYPQYELIGEYPDTSHLNSRSGIRPDFILLDINLPGRNGLDSCADLKGEFPSCKIIALTQLSGMKKTLVKVGFDGYVEKGNADVLVTAIETVLNGGTYFETPAAKRAPLQPMEEDLQKYRNLTDREPQVAWYISDGYSNPELAKLLHVSELTIKVHRKNIYNKLGQKGALAVSKFLQNCGACREPGHDRLT